MKRYYKCIKQFHQKQLGNRKATHPVASIIFVRLFYDFITPMVNNVTSLMNWEYFKVYWIQIKMGIFPQNSLAVIYVPYELEFLCFVFIKSLIL